MRFVCWIFLLALGLTGCASKSETKRGAPLMSQPMASRFTKPDMTRRSIYEKSMQSNLAKEKGIGSWFSARKSPGKSFSGSKSFAGARDFKTGRFAAGDHASSMAGQGFAEGDKAPADAAKGFPAPASRFQGQAAADGSKTFADADAVFGTTANRDALKARQKNVRPEFVEFEDQKRDPAYTEQQVRRLLGRD